MLPIQNLLLKKLVIVLFCIIPLVTDNVPLTVSPVINALVPVKLVTHKVAIQFATSNDPVTTSVALSVATAKLPVLSRLATVLVLQDLYQLHQLVHQHMLLLHTSVPLVGVPTMVIMFAEKLPDPS